MHLSISGGNAKGNISACVIFILIEEIKMHSVDLMWKGVKACKKSVCNLLSHEKTKPNNERTQHQDVCVSI